MKLLYSLAFLLGADNWKLPELPVEILESLKAFNKEKTQVLDLGCGRGQESISLASKGWHVLGVDFIPLAIRQARKAAKTANVLDRTRFITADVSNLSTLELPQIQFAYDIGCFHLLDPKQVEGYIEGVNQVLESDGLLLLNAFTPRQQGKKVVGYSLDAVRDLFSPAFEIEKTNDHSYWRFPANWYWLRKVGKRRN